MIYIGADHRGYELKERLRAYLEKKKIEIFDAGATEEDKDDDYPDYAKAVGKKISEAPDEHKGILICGSGHGVDMVANKFKGVRAALAFNAQVAMQSRAHEDANVLVLAADWLTPEEAEKIVDAWLQTEFDHAERNRRRLKKIEEIEDSL